MEVMARLLAAGASSSQTVAEDDYARQKSVAEYIYRQLHEADDPNLLHEEDMHVYGERPMTDPLQLVCCNVCKKPIIDSQFAAHAELCRSLKLTDKTGLELVGNKKNQKPPRKEKRKLPASRATTAVREQRRSESVDNIDTVVSQTHLISQSRVTLSSTEVKACVDAASNVDDTGINPGNRDLQVSVMHPPAKRHKLIASTHLPVLKSNGTESGVTSLTDEITRKDLIERTVSEDGESGHKNLGQAHMQHQHLMKNDFPAPLATKIYYSQRTNRLRASIRHLYFQNLSEELHTDVAGPKTSHGEMVAMEDSSQRDTSFDQMDSVLIKESHSAIMHSAQKSDGFPAKSSAISFPKVGDLSIGGLSNHFVLDNVSLSPSAATHVGLSRDNFLPKSHSFAANTGNPLGTMQQANGSVPVI